MRVPRLALAAVAATGAIALSGCADDLYGPYGYGYGSYGYGYSPYGYGNPYGGYGYYGSYDPFGWYGDYYYPGVGIYVYDSSRRARRWNDRERNYWTSRRQATTTTTSGTRTTTTTQNWSAFNQRHRHP